MSTYRLQTYPVTEIDKFVNHAIGFDSLFDKIFGNTGSFQQTGFPPHNVIKSGETSYSIEFALAGFKRDDIEIEYRQGSLTIRSIDKKEEVLDESSDHEMKYLHRGIAKRSFKRTIALYDDIVVNGAKLVDGMLTINLERIIPEEKKPKLISIDE